MTLLDILKKELQRYGEVTEQRIDSKVILAFKCSACGKVIAAATPTQLYTNTSRHLKKHGVKI